MNNWSIENYPQIKNECVRVACIDAQKRSIRGRLQSNYERTKDYQNGKEYLLSYFDNCPFYGYSVKQSGYKNLTMHLNNEAKRGSILKLHRGSGSYARYVFPKKELEKMIDEVILEISKEEAMSETAT